MDLQQSLHHGNAKLIFFGIFCCIGHTGLTQWVVAGWWPHNLSGSVRMDSLTEGAYIEGVAVRTCTGEGANHQFLASTL